MAQLADAVGSKPAALRGMWVRIPLRAPCSYRQQRSRCLREPPWSPIGWSETRRTCDTTRQRSAQPCRSASVKERGLSSMLRTRAVERWSSLVLAKLVDAVPHQGVSLRVGSVARHLSALFESAWCGRASEPRLFEQVDGP